jgi:hypothetical protein
VSFAAPGRFAPRARPISELPVQTLLAGEQELARRWAIALIDASPSADIAHIPLEELTREAPALCGAVIRAVQSDDELERLTGRQASAASEFADSAGRVLRDGDPADAVRVVPASRLAAIAGARDREAMVVAAEILRGVLWEALREQLGRAGGARPSPWLLADASDRLAHVCAAMLAVSIDTRSSEGPSGPLAPPATSAAVARDPRPAASTTGPTRSGLARTGDAVIVDEGTSVPVAPGGAAIEIRDQRREEGPSAWVRSIGAQLEQFARDERPFAVLLVELVEIERMRRDALPEELWQLADQVEQALAATVGELSGSLTRERPGRCWVLAPNTDTAGAALLEHHITRAVASATSHRGEPLAVVVGTAVCPRDGREASTLAAHADVGLYAARAALRTSALP